MITLFIVLANGIVIKCIGAICDTTSTVLFATMAAEGAIELVFSIRGVIKIFADRDTQEKPRKGRRSTDK